MLRTSLPLLERQRYTTDLPCSPSLARPFYPPFFCRSLSPFLSPPPSPFPPSFSQMQLLPFTQENVQFHELCISGIIPTLLQLPLENTVSKSKRCKRQNSPRFSVKEASQSCLVSLRMMQENLDPNICSLRLSYFYPSEIVFPSLLSSWLRHSSPPNNLIQI